MTQKDIADITDFSNNEELWKEKKAYFDKYAKVDLQICQ